MTFMQGKRGANKFASTLGSFKGVSRLEVGGSAKNVLHKRGGSGEFNRSDFLVISKLSGRVGMVDSILLPMGPWVDRSTVRVKCLPKQQYNDHNSRQLGNR